MQHYNIEWLTQRFYNGDKLKYLFFWGHTANNSNEVNKASLSQWFPLPFTVDDITYPTAEHWMMAHKALLFDDKVPYKKILSAETPKKAKELGRMVQGFDSLIWEEHCFEIVKNGNIHKFNQHPAYATFLMSMPNHIIVEASPVDTVWGIGLKESDEDAHIPTLWRGQNLLGFALMEVRDFLITFGHFKPFEVNVSLPWKTHPLIDPCDLFWRMGKGEELLHSFHQYYHALSEHDKVVFRLTYPAPYRWQPLLD